MVTTTSQTTLSSESQKAILHRYYDEIWSAGNLALIDEFMAPDYLNRDPATPGEVVAGREAFKQFVMTYRTAFPDLQMKIDRQIAEGDTVVSHWTATGTHRAPLLGIPPTNRPGSVNGITISRFRDGQIVEDDVIWDTLGLLKQLGIIPELGPAA